MSDIGSSILFDSVILIDHFNGIEAATTYLSTVGSAGFISTITRAEVLARFDEPDFSRAQALMNAMNIIPIDTRVADMAARLRRQYRWKLPDALQAACATVHGATLATRNTREFDPSIHDFVTIPYQL